MRLAICGAGEAGKDTLAELLAAEFGLRFYASTSTAAARIVWQTVPGFCAKYPTALACWADRRNHRQVWHDAILAWNRSWPSGVRLYEELAADHDLLVGIRDRGELGRCRELGIVDAVLWIERPGFGEAATSCSVHARDCDLVLRNEGTLEEFRQRGRVLGRLWVGGRKNP